MQAVEEDGDEIFTRISDVRCCGHRLRKDDGFWRCPSCRCSYGPVDEPKRGTKLGAEL